MKYSKNYIRDFNWLLSVRHLFNFSGSADRDIAVSLNGVDGKQAFYLFDSKGVLKETRHPNIVNMLIRVKSSINLHIKMYAEDLANGVMLPENLNEISKEFNAPVWFADAVINQSKKL